MTRKLETMKLSGNEYAKVPVRLKAFREENPRGGITTTHELLDDGQIVFTAHVVKDRSDPYSAEATGHSYGKQGQVKAFEKLETVAVGRALALLGYLISGEIASSEEMEQFEQYKADQISEVVGTIKSMSTLDELKEYFLSLGASMNEPEVIKAKDQRKAELTK